jgi:hypothetical protein
MYDETASPAMPAAESASPVAEPAPEVFRVPPLEPVWRKRGTRALRLMGLAVLWPLGLWALTGLGLESAWVGLFAEPVITVAAVLYGIGAITEMLRTPQEVPSSFAVVVALVPVLGGGVMTLIEAMGVFGTFFARGRQLRRWGRVLLPRVETGAPWAHLELSAEVEPALREALAERWRENGRTEHASVAAFAQLTLDLLALGAPPALVHAANRDARDEIRHAELCFSLARALDGREAGPAPFPEVRQAHPLPAERSRALASLAVDSLVDGALREGVSARVIARLAQRCTEPAIREVLRELAADEGRHSAHGWDVVEWCLAQGGAPVARALRGAMQVLPRSVHATVPEAAREGGWERYGIHGQALESEEFAKAWAHLADRVEALTHQVGAQAA